MTGLYAGLAGAKGANKCEEALIERLLRFFQRGLYSLEIGQVFRRGGLLRVNNGALFVDDEDRTGRRVADPGDHRANHVVEIDDLLVQVAEQLDADLFVFGPAFLRERAVHADAVDRGVQVLVGSEAAGDVAHFLRADAGEGEREENKHRVALAEIIAELDVFQTLRGLGFQGEIGSGGANFESHGSRRYEVKS